MSGLEEALGQVLADPSMMEQLKALAQTLGTGAQEPAPPAQPGPDPGMLRQIAAMAGSAGVDQSQQALLRALGPYVSRERSWKLERAMRAARMASLASALLSGR